MGLKLSLTEIDESGRQLCPGHCLKQFPSNERFARPAPGNLITYLKANPPDTRYDGPNLDGLFWWVDCEFLAYRDDTVLVCYGLYQERPSRPPVSTCAKLQGTAYILQFSEKIKCQRVKDSKTSAMPLIQSHPSGEDILYLQNGKVTLLNLETENTVTRLTHHSPRYTTVSPNGHYVAVLSRLGIHFELTMFANREFVTLIEESSVSCHKLLRGFEGTRTYQEHVECKFSPDSTYLAVSSSMGLLFVVRGFGLKLHCTVIPGIIDDSVKLLANARTFDFDPRYKHAHLAVGLNDTTVAVCDIDTQEIINEWRVDTEGGLDSMKYNTQGTALAVATSDARIHIYNSDLCDLLYTLDGSQISTEAARMNIEGGRYPSTIRLSYSRTGDVLISTATDGIIRLWQLYPDLRLLHITRTAVLKHCPINKLKQLPLPPAIIQDLLAWPRL